MSRTAFLPVALDVRGRRCTVIGGGKVALQKVRVLLRTETAVQVISPDLVAELAELHRNGEIEWVRRGYQPGDLAGAFIAFACTGVGEVDAAVARAAAACGILLNAATRPFGADGNVVMPAVHRSGGLQIAVSTEGQSPTLARILRDRLAGQFGPQYGVVLDYLAAVRGPVKAAGLDRPTRSRFYRELVETLLPPDGPGSAGDEDLVERSRPVLARYGVRLKA